MDKNLNIPLVSILLPVYNMENYIRNSIKSIFKQSYQLFELIIINDGSKDNTINEIKKFNDSRIKIIDNANNLGIQKTLNKGIIASSGKYIARLDADDEWINKDKLKNQIEFLENNTEYVLIGTGAVYINEQGKYLYKYLKPKTNKKIKKTLLGYNCFIHSSVVFRRNSVLSVGLYSEEKTDKHIEDYNLWLKLGTIGKLYNLSSYDINLMKRNDSVGHKNLIEQLTKTIQIAKKFKKYYPHNKFINLMRNNIRLILYKYFKIFISLIQLFKS